MRDHDEQRRERSDPWDAFVRTFLPATILEIFPSTALQDLLRGFFLKIRRGVTLLYAHRKSGNIWSFETAGRLDPLDTEQGISGEFLNPVCFELRQSWDVEQRCLRCYQEHAELCRSGATTNPASYTCWLGLIDLVCPVRLEGNIVAFVFAGQIPPNEPEELVKAKARLSEVCGAKAEELGAMLDQQVRQRAGAGITAHQETHQTQEQLRTFVAALETIMGTLHASSKRAAEDDLLRYWEANLPTVEHTDESEWWRRVAELAQGFLDQLGMGRVTLFVRDGKNFDQRWPNANNDFGPTPLRLATRAVLQAVEPEHLVHAADPCTLQLAGKVSTTWAETCFYRSRTTSADAQPGLLFAVEGRPSAHFTSLAEKFLGRLCSKTEYVALTFQLKRIHQQYVQTVSDAAHDFRHPLQLLEFKIAELIAMPAISQDQAHVNELQKIKLRLRQAQEQTLSLQRQESDSKDVFNLVDLLDEVIEFMTPKADAHPCVITRSGNWPDTVLIRANRGQMFKVFLNLIDNAIKYSFMGLQYDVRIQVFAVDWTVSDGSVKVMIQNFGVGIPGDRLANLGKRGGRAEVPDERRRREGTGIGLNIAVRILSEHGATLEIESHPEPEDSSRPTMRSRPTAIGLRYLTTVTVRLRPAKSA